MQKKKDNLSSAVAGLEELFSILNNHFYDGSLVHPIITVIPRGRHKKTTGWCSNSYRWETNKPTDNSDSKAYYELNICAEDLASDFEIIVETMLHQMVHLYNAMNSIPDTSREGTYHNTHFKEVAETHGLIVEKHPTYGFSITHLTPVTREYIQTLSGFHFDFFRTEMQTQTKKRQSTIKLTCPICGCIARVTSPKTKIMCTPCKSAMYRLD